MRVYIKDYDREVEFPAGTPKDVMLKALRENFPADPYKEEISQVERSMGVPPTAPISREETIQTAPESSFWGNMASRLFTPSMNKDKASNIITLSEQTGLSPSRVSKKYEELTGQIAEKTYPTAKRAAEVGMGAGIVAGLVANPIHTAIALGTFMGLDELKNAFVSYASNDEYEFQGGKGVSDLLQLEGFSKDAVDLAEFVAEAWAAGKVSGATKSLANAVRNIVKPEEKVKFINDVAKDVKKEKITIEEAVRKNNGNIEERPVVEQSVQKQPWEKTR